MNLKAMKAQCLFGDICPFNDCNQCMEYAPVDANGLDDRDMSEDIHEWRRQWARMLERDED